MPQLFFHSYIAGSRVIFGFRRAFALVFVVCAVWHDPLRIALSVWLAELLARPGFPRDSQLAQPISSLQSFRGMRIALQQVPKFGHAIILLA